MSKKIVAVTACAAGIAHTYMAAESIEKAAKKMGYEVKVETNGAIGAENVLTPEEIENADLVLVASDIKIDPIRFTGKPLYVTKSIPAIEDSEALIKKHSLRLRFLARKEVRWGISRLVMIKIR